MSCKILWSREDRWRNTGAADGSVSRSSSHRGYVARGDAQVSTGLGCGDQPGPSSAASPPWGQQPRLVWDDSTGELSCYVVDSACPSLPSTVSPARRGGTAGDALGRVLCMVLVPQRRELGLEGAKGFSYWW